MRYLLIILSLFSILFSKNSNKDIIGKWVDKQPYLESNITIFKTDEGVLINIVYRKDGRIEEKKGYLSNDSKGKRIDYKNNNHDYFLIYDNSKLAYCDNFGCFLELESTYFNKELLNNSKETNYNIKKTKIVLSESTKNHFNKIKSLYYDLLSFKNNLDFIEHGFDTNYSYNPWLLEVQNLQNQKLENNELLENFGFMSGDLEILGMEYVVNKGNESDYTLQMKSIITGAIKYELSNDIKNINNNDDFWDEVDKKDIKKYKSNSINFGLFTNRNLDLFQISKDFRLNDTPLSLYFSVGLISHGLGLSYQSKYNNTGVIANIGFSSLNKTSEASIINKEYFIFSSYSYQIKLWKTNAFITLGLLCVELEDILPQIAIDYRF